MCCLQARRLHLELGRDVAAEVGILGFKLEPTHVEQLQGTGMIQNAA
jgi:hypothetical protein